MTVSRPVALVTGGTRGIGLGIAQALSGDGWDLALCGTRPEAEIADVLTGLRRLGAAVAYWQADVGIAEDRARLLGGIRAQYGALHALGNNAGRAPRVR